MKKTKELKDVTALARKLRSLVSQDDLCMASKSLPADHPIRPALKAAIDKSRGGSFKRGRV